VHPQWKLCVHDNVYKIPPLDTFDVQSISVVSDDVLPEHNVYNIMFTQELTRTRKLSVPVPAPEKEYAGRALLFTFRNARVYNARQIIGDARLLFLGRLLGRFGRTSRRQERKAILSFEGQ
jgi:hypothetical protein